MKKIKFNLRKMSDGNLEVITQAIIKAMTDSPFFPGAPQELTDAAAATIAFSKALAISKMGGKNEQADKKVKRKDLIVAFFALFNYVSLTANGNEQVLTASGFDLTKDRMPSPPLGDVRIISVSNSGSNEITVAIKPIPNVRLYEFRFTPDPITENSEWVRQPTTLSKWTFKNLESGKRYWFMVAAMGVNEQVKESEPFQKMAA